MIRTMYQFGQHLREVEDMKPYFEIAAAPYPEKATDDIVIIAEIKDRQFQRLTLDPYKKTLVPKYLFRELAAARATSIVPTLHFFFAGNDKALDDSCTKFLDKLARCVENNKTIYEKHFEVLSLMKGMQNDLKAFVQDKFTEKRNYLFTLRIEDNLLGDIPDIKAILEKSSYDKYFRDGKGELFRGENKTCAVTYQENQEVWGRVDTLGFTVNDIAFSRNGFDAKDSYKMFPVSPDAVKVLEGTMRALDNVMSFTFSNLKFFVLPHFVTLCDDLIQKKRIVRKFVKVITGPPEPGFDPMAKAIINSESVFSDILADPDLGNNSLYYDIFFYEELQAQFAVKLHVSDVIPSRFQKILDIKEAIEVFYRPITSRKNKKDEIELLHLNFFLIKNYFAIERFKKPPLIEPYFFKIIEAIFHKNRLNEEQVLRAFMQKIVAAFKNFANDKYAFDNHVKNAFCIHQFFQQLQLFGNMEQKTKGELALTAIEFVEQHGNFFDHHLKKAAFHLGCATEKLLNHQDRRYGGNKPFLKNLLNLYVDFGGMGEIFHKLTKKAAEYANDTDPIFPYVSFNEILGVFGEEIGGGNSDNVTKTEISFAFSLGMTMEKQFRYRRGKANTLAMQMQSNI